MRTKDQIKIYISIALILILTTACNMPTAVAPPASQPPAGGNGSSSNNNTASDNNSASDNNAAAPTNTTAPEESAPTDTTAPPTETSTPTPTLAHVSYPGQPGYNYYMTDPSSKSYASEGRSVSDAFDSLFFERPFTAPDMVYKPYLDIIRGNISVTSPYVYITIRTEGAAPTDSTAHYGVEIDTDKDGRGDWLVYGQVPNTTDWTTVGVRVYEDGNNDVGGATPIYADGPSSGLDGYETMLFNQGYDTTDPDMAWIRRDPSNAKWVNLAFKYNVIGSADQFMWGIWSDDGPVNPAWFDYNDHFTEEQAGSPLLNSPYYPLNELALVDNTCRWVFGFNPTGDEPGICEIPKPTATPTIPPTYTISGNVFRDDNYDGARNGSEPGLSGLTVTLGSGSCDSAGLASATTSGSGNFSFTGLAPGTYCVTVVISLSNCGWHTQTGKKMTINLTGDTNISFGFVQFIC